MKSDYRDLAIDEVKTRLVIAEFISNPKGLVLVDEVDGLITGVLVGFVDEMWWSRKRYSIALINFAERPGAIVWMLRRFMKWSFDQKGAEHAVLDCSFGGPLGAKTEKLYQRIRGVERVGESFIARKPL